MSRVIVHFVCILWREIHFMNFMMILFTLSTHIIIIVIIDRLHLKHVTFVSFVNILNNFGSVSISYPFPMNIDYWPLTIELTSDTDNLKFCFSFIGTRGKKRIWSFDFDTFRFVASWLLVSKLSISFVFHIFPFLTV